MADDDPEAVDADGGEEAAPLDELADRIRTRQSPADDVSDEPLANEAEVGEQFMDMGATIGASEGERTDPGEPATVFDEPSDDLFDFEPAVESDAAVDEYVVSKRSYCESCEYLSEPPEFRCTHSGTTIVEFVDTDHVRVRECPIVAERQLLGEFEE